MIEHDWYRKFFDGLAVQFWTEVVPDELTRQEIDLIIAKLDVSPGAHLLDIPCGAGRHAQAMTARGFEVTGVDVSESFLRMAQAHASERFHLVRSDMSEFSVETRFDGAYCMGNSFGYLPCDAQCRFLENVSAVLKPGAGFLIEASIAAEVLLPQFEDEERLGTAETQMTIKNSYDPFKSCMITEYQFVSGTSTETRTSLHYVYTIAEITRMLAAAELRVIDLFGSPAGTPYEFGDPQLYVVADKQVR